MKTKNKRMPRLSIIRLYKMAQAYIDEKITKKTSPIRNNEILDFLEYINNHKNDTL